MSGSDKPWIVVKVGGEIVDDDGLRAGLLANVQALVQQQLARIVIVHGGGPQATRLQTKLGLSTVKALGQRLTRPEDLAVVVQAVCGEVNVALTNALIGAGVGAVGISGIAAGMVTATMRKPLLVDEQGVTRTVEYGLVGDVSAVDTTLLSALCDAGYVPVVGTLGRSSDGQILNVNADESAASIAVALRATHLLMVTAVGGVRGNLHDAASRIARIAVADVPELIASGAISDGMIPKIKEAAEVASTGVGAVVIVGVDVDAFIAVVRGDSTHGTQVTA